MKIAVGDRGQRYEITYLDSAGARKVFGWTETAHGALGFVSSINLNPSMSDPEIRDRRPGPFDSELNADR